MGIQECNHQSSYLGLPFFKAASLSRAFNSLIDKLKAKLGGWKAKNLSQADRSVLIKHVAQAIPMYTM